MKYKTNNIILKYLSKSSFTALQIHKAIKEVKKMQKYPIFFSFNGSFVNKCNIKLLNKILKKQKIKIVVVSDCAIVNDILLNYKTNISNDNNSDQKYEILYDFVSTYKNDINFTSPSYFIKTIGKCLGSDSFINQCFVNQIPIFCPSLTDNLIGKVLFELKTNLCMDLLFDIKKINKMCVFEKKAGGIVLGNGMIKHHVLNANLFRNGLDSLVVVNSNCMMDGSDSGASIEEAVSWGKVKPKTKSVKVEADPSVVFPMIPLYGFDLINK